MRFQTIKSTLTAVLFCGLATSVFAQMPPPSDPMTPPPSADEMFMAMDTNHDGVISREEFQAWFDMHFGAAPMTSSEPMPGPMTGPMTGPGPMPGPMDGGMPMPPKCSEEMRQSEQQPQQTNVMASNGKQGNLLFRTVCGDMPGYDQVAISLPSGRQALDFGVEAITSGNVVFGIRVEGGANVYHSSAGKAALQMLNISAGTYTVYLDAAASDPGSRVTVRFIDTAQ